MTTNRRLYVIPGWGQFYYKWPQIHVSDSKDPKGKQWHVGDYSLVLWAFIRARFIIISNYVRHVADV